jgi:hypothetical protein
MTRASDPRQAGEEERVREGRWRVSVGCDGTLYLYLFTEGRGRVVFSAEAEDDGDPENAAILVKWPSNGTSTYPIPRAAIVAMRKALGEDQPPRGASKE